MDLDAEVSGLALIPEPSIRRLFIPLVGEIFDGHYFWIKL